MERSERTGSRGKVVPEDHSVRSRRDLLNETADAVTRAREVAQVLSGNGGTGPGGPLLTLLMRPAMGGKSFRSSRAFGLKAVIYNSFEEVVCGLRCKARCAL
jgi:hypothetical protein